MADDDSVSKQLDELFSTENLVIISWILLVPTVAAFTYGVVSWCLIKKFRNFRNYVFLSAILANVIGIIVFELCMALVTPIAVLQYPVLRTIPISLLMYCKLSFHCWLLVLCYYFYVDFVKVFHREFRRRYLKSGLFAWGLPFILSVVYFIAALFCYVYNSSGVITDYVFQVLTKTIIIIPVMINFVIYVLVVRSLFRDCNCNSASTTTSKWCRFYMATLIFFLSNIIELTVILEIFDVQVFFLVVLGELGIYLNTIALDVFIVIVRSNRELWSEFFDRRSKQNWKDCGPGSRSHQTSVI